MFLIYTQISSIFLARFLDFYMFTGNVIGEWDRRSSGTKTFHYSNSLFIILTFVRNAVICLGFLVYPVFFFTLLLGFLKLYNWQR